MMIDKQREAQNVTLHCKELIDSQKEKVCKSIKSAIFGHAVGDALGLPVEFMSRKKLVKCPVTDFLPWDLAGGPKGIWSDDTSMTLSTLKSLTEQGRFVPDDLMEQFRNWIQYGSLSPFGRAIGIGRTTFRAVMDYSNGKTAGGISSRDKGNGSLMRIAPVILYQHFVLGNRVSWEKKIQDIHAASALTHATETAMTACGIYAFLMDELLAKADPLSVQVGLQQAKDFYKGSTEAETFAFLFLKDFPQVNRSHIHSSGYVVDTLEAAVWCLTTTNDYSACVLKAVNLGGDTDTIAAVAGALAGVLYGVEAIPEKWISTLALRAEIEILCESAAERWFRILERMDDHAE